jgi:tetratricopeptide (TPR) repeat protein
MMVLRLAIRKTHRSSMKRLSLNVARTWWLALGLMAHQAAAAPGDAAAPAVPGPAQPASASVTAAQEGASSLLRGNTSQAITQYTDALKDQTLTNDRRGAILGDRAVAYARSGQTKLAIDDFNRAIQLFPEHAATYNNRGNLLLALGLPKEAIRDFDRAVLLAPGYAAAYANRAGAYDRLGQQDDAIRDYTRSIELAPASAVPLAGRGRVLLTLGKPHAAIRDFGRAVAADARFANAYRGRAAAKLRIRRYDDAIEDLSRAIAFDNGNVELYILRGHAYLGMRNFASGLRDFSRAIELDGKSSAAYAGRGLANGFVEAFDDGFADLNRAIDLDPKNATVFSYRAIVYSQAGQTDVGLKDVETALKLDANRAEAFWARGTIAEQLGRTSEAVADYRHALSKNSELALAAEGLARLGGEMPDSADTPVAGLGIDGWSVVARGNEYYAVNTEQPALRVPLESRGSGQPKLLDWELKKAPFKGIGVLRFNGGTVAGKDGPAEVEMIALVDIQARSVITVEPNKLGSKTATWTWEEGKVTVASIDGVTDEFNVRAAVGADQGPTDRQKRVRNADGRNARDADADSEDRSKPERERPQRSAGNSRPSQKPKSIFQLLFGN